MHIELSTPHVGGLAAAVNTLREWQSDSAPLQLHPGDIGWNWQFGAEETAAAVRIWRRAGRMVAMGFLDSAEMIRLTTAPDVRNDESLARRVVEDVADPERGVLPSGRVALEAPNGALVAELLSASGWKTDAPWTPLQRDLTEPVEESGLRVEVVGPELAPVRAAVHRAAFDSRRFTVEHWKAMAAGVAYADARCLVGYDDRDNPVAMTTVWSAGPGRPGLLEPLGVDPAHRGHGHGRAISLAAAAALRELGSSSAQVCTPSDNVGAVATYRSADFRALPERHDRYRASLS